MNKSQFVDALSAKFEGNKKAAAEALDAVVDTITREVARGEKVVITGFGAFEKRVREARVVRNPQTGELIEAAKKAVPKFTPGADLRNVISGAKQLPAATVEAAGDAASGLVAKVTGRGSRKTSTSEPAPTDTATDAAPATKTPAKKTPAKKTPAKKAPAKKAPAKKAPAKKAPATKAAAKKAPATKTPATKAATTESTTSSSTPATKAAAKKAPATKAAAKKAPAKKAPAKKAPAKKAPAKKATGAADTPAPEKPSSDA
ncbi:HU family DNA-binding protein [Nocardioides zeae]|uniref:HU family DNA-binding protein n=1 Tax=Nocardioides zeae TaxID=1457234 RepID=A0A6P0HN46_9ACTN|nr:HU family DNA-binding protein [Nocardioides zeae]